MESDDAFNVKADAPGFDPEDVNISLKDGVITIFGRKDADKKQEWDGKVSWARHSMHIPQDSIAGYSSACSSLINCCALLCASPLLASRSLHPVPADAPPTSALLPD